MATRRADQVKGLHGFMCPITAEVMTDPVITCDGQTYERRAIEKWFQRGNLTSPMTGLALPTTIVTPNHALRQVIQEYFPAMSVVENKILDMREEMSNLQMELNLKDDREFGNQNIFKKFLEKRMTLLNRKKELFKTEIQQIDERMSQLEKESEGQKELVNSRNEKVAIIVAEITDKMKKKENLEFQIENLERNNPMISHSISLQNSLQPSEYVTALNAIITLESSIEQLETTKRKIMEQINQEKPWEEELFMLQERKKIQSMEYERQKELENDLLMVGIGDELQKMKEYGFEVEEFRAAGYNPRELLAANFTVMDLKLGGYTVAEFPKSIAAELLREGGYSVVEMREGGLSVHQLRVAGYGIDEMKQGGFTGQEMSLSWDVTNLMRSGYTFEEFHIDPQLLRQAGCTVLEMRDYGFHAIKLKKVGFPPAMLWAGGVPIREFLQAYRLDEVKSAGYRIHQMFNEGFQIEAMRNAGFTIQDFKAAKVFAQDLIGIGVSLRELQEGGYKACQLCKAGAKISKLRLAGYSDSEIKQAGFPRSDLAGAGIYLSR
jgi:hypothetical protein